MATEVSRSRWAFVVGAVVLTLIGALLAIPFFASTQAGEPSLALDSTRASTTPTALARAATTPAAVLPKPRPTKAKKPVVKWVLAISVDGLNPEALRTLGPTKAPNFYRLMAEGAYTLNARTEYEATQTLPNHTGMVTGRPVSIARAGHGVTFNEDNGSTVQRTTGYPVRSIFSVVHKKLGRTALFASKPKFNFLQRSWPTSIDRYTMIEDNDVITAQLLADMDSRRKFRLLHLSAPDSAGHAYGWMSERYLTNVQETDARIGLIMNKIKSTKRLRKSMMLLVTADHGGQAQTHMDPTLYADYRIPFFAWGRGVEHGNLYAINPRYADPGTTRPTYAGKQPIRNGDIANLTTKLLGIKPVKGSQIGVKQKFNLYAD